VFEHHYRELLNFLIRRVGNRDLAADLVQESFARVYAAAGARAVTEPRALLYTTARNLVTDHHRRTSLRETHRSVENVGGETLEPDEHVGLDNQQPDVILSGRQRLAAIERALAALPPRPREAFVLYKIDGLSRAEVAKAMGVGIKTVETHLEVAMRSCMRHLQELDQPPRQEDLAGGQRPAKGKPSR